MEKETLKESYSNYELFKNSFSYQLKSVSASKKHLILLIH